MIRKEEGFAGQVSIVLPNEIKGRLKKNQIVGDLFLTDIGYYPKAQGHYRERPNGADENILIYTIEGEGKVALGKDIFILHENEFFIIPQHASHWYKANEKNPWTIYWVHFSGQKSAFLNDRIGKVHSLPPTKHSRIRERLQLFDEIIEVLGLGFSPDNLEYANLCLVHLLASFRYLVQYRKVNYAEEKDIVKRSILFMKQNIHVPLSLENFASHEGISASHFSRIFKQRTRHSPINYFIQMKIQQACQQLDYSQLRVHEIAHSLGYEDVFYFSRLFKNIMGVAPKEYRQKGNVKVGVEKISTNLSNPLNHNMK